MKPFPDLYRIMKQRATRKAHHSIVYSILEIHSLSIKNDEKTLLMSLPVLPQWVDHDQLISQSTLCLIIDTIPGIYSMSINPFHPSAVNLGVRFFSRPKQGSLLSITVKSSISSQDKLGTLRYEIRCEETLVAIGKINMIFNQNSFWRSEKL
jgi:hypothetical protein